MRCCDFCIENSSLIILYRTIATTFFMALQTIQQSYAPFAPNARKIPDALNYTPHLQISPNRRFPKKRARWCGLRIGQDVASISSLIFFRSERRESMANEESGGDIFCALCSRFARFSCALFSSAREAKREEAKN